MGKIGKYNRTTKILQPMLLTILMEDTITTLCQLHPLSLEHVPPLIFVRQFWWNKLSFILSFLFHERLYCYYIYFTTLTCTSTIITLEPCALNAELIALSWWDLIKCPYFADTTERGDWGRHKAQRKGYFPDNSYILKSFHIKLVPGDSKGKISGQVHEVEWQTNIG